MLFWDVMESLLMCDVKHVAILFVDYGSIHSNGTVLYLIALKKTEAEIAKKPIKKQPYYRNRNLSKYIEESAR